MTTTVRIESFGTVTQVRMPLVTVTGLANITNNEVVLFESGKLGQVLSFSGSEVTIMALDQSPIKIGSTVTGTGQPLEINLDQSILGQVISPLGETVIKTSSTSSSTTPLKPQSRRIDTHPLPLEARSAITDQLVTGISYVDSLLPLAKGQRELIVGDRQTEKTPFLYQVMVAQAKLGSKIVFGLVGKRFQEIAQLSAFISSENIQDSVVVVASSSEDSPSVISLTPFTAMTVAEYLRDEGSDVLVIFDDLTTHAKYVREVALLANQFPGRDSYPGNIFYTHARLLERAGAFKVGTQSLAITALPVAQSQENELTDFIVSNLISITDGHLLFDTNLKKTGHHPPINTGLSVTRVGKQTQTALARQLNRELNILLNRYHKLLALTHFGNELAADAQLLLRRGEVLVQFLEQQSTENVPQSIQQIGTAIIVLGWWDDADPDQIKNYRQAITKASQTKEFSSIFASLAQLTSYDQFSQQLHAHKKTLESLWQH